MQNTSALIRIRIVLHYNVPYFNAHLIANVCIQQSHGIVDFFPSKIVDKRWKSDTLYGVYYTRDNIVL